MFFNFKTLSSLHTNERHIGVSSSLHTACRRPLCCMYVRIWPTDMVWGWWGSEWPRQCSAIRGHDKARMGSEERWCDAATPQSCYRGGFKHVRNLLTYSDQLHWSEWETGEDQVRRWQFPGSVKVGRKVDVMQTKCRRAMTNHTVTLCQLTSVCTKLANILYLYMWLVYCESYCCVCSCAVNCKLNCPTVGFISSNLT